MGSTAEDRTASYGTSDTPEPIPCPSLAHPVLLPLLLAPIDPVHMSRGRHPPARKAKVRMALGSSPGPS
jgi:hypothetical protein